MKMLLVFAVVLPAARLIWRKGIDGLATIIGDKYGQNPFEKGTLFLFWEALIGGWMGNRIPASI